MAPEQTSCPPWHLHLREEYMRETSWSVLTACVSYVCVIKCSKSVHYTPANESVTPSWDWFLQDSCLQHLSVALVHHIIWLVIPWICIILLMLFKVVIEFFFLWIKQALHVKQVIALTCRFWFFSPQNSELNLAISFFPYSIKNKVSYDVFLAIASLFLIIQTFLLRIMSLYIAPLWINIS